MIPYKECGEEYVSFSGNKNIALLLLDLFLKEGLVVETDTERLDIIKEQINKGKLFVVSPPSRKVFQEHPE